MNFIYWQNPLIYGTLGPYQHQTKDAKSLVSNQETIQNQALSKFLKEIELKAFKMAHIATGNQDDALDIVQDAMVKLCDKYAANPQEEWPPLFYRILQNKIFDWHRRSKIRNQIIRWLPGVKDMEQDNDFEFDAPDLSNNDPSQLLEHQRAFQHLEIVLHQLPLRQQQAFMLRSWEGLSVEETAKVLGCSEGSVKTHLSRAMNKIKEQMEGY
ncbi:MAG: RNA polymerase sigma factor, partial [Gammaproteobacteria bacterium]|nr:RNA polymerase sigma factor [Gammaproteobacteria bacterium]